MSLELATSGPALAPESSPRARRRVIPQALPGAATVPLSQAQPAPTPPESSPGPAPAAFPPLTGSSAPAEPELAAVRVCVSDEAVLRDDTLAPLDPVTLIPLGAPVLLLEETRSSAGTYARVRVTVGTQGVVEAWTLASNLAEQGPRPVRPSTPEAQMTAVLSVAASRARQMDGHCYRAVKGYIRDAGGFGDILDIYKDERFRGFQGSAVDFAAAVDRWGADALGLVEVRGLPMEATPGTLLVIKGNGKMSLSETHGDISVIGGLVGAERRSEVRRVRDANALLRAEDLSPSGGVVPLDSYVWVLEEREVGGLRYCRVAEAEDGEATESGAELGWTAASNLDGPQRSDRALLLYNDGKLKLEVDPNTWQTGRYQGILVGMYMPVPRP